MRTFVPLGAALLLSLAACGVHADQASARGQAIAEEMESRDRGWGDQQVALEMVLRSPSGAESRRRLRVSTLEVAGDGDRTLAVFDSPPDVRGAALLTHTHLDAPDEQWLYLPELRRVRRITTANRAGPFMGSEFAFEDLTSQEPERYRYRWLRNERADGRDTFVLERVPVYEGSGYRRQIVWVDQMRYQPLRIDFYDHRDAHQKSLRFHGYRHHLDRHWRAEGMEMVNHQTGAGTTLIWRDYRLRTGLGPGDLDPARLVHQR
jgi:outer membrane lipoprotein-sorting protein